MRGGSASLTVALAVALTANFGVIEAVGQADFARAFPSRANQIVVPFPPGGPTDINIRIIAQRMSEDWKQPVVIENRPGRQHGDRGASRGTRRARRLHAARRDGLDAGDEPGRRYRTAQLRSLQRLRRHDHDGEEHVAADRAGERRPAQREGTDRARKDGPAHLRRRHRDNAASGYLLGQLAGIELQFIPYKGSSEVVQGLLSGSVDFIIDGAAPSIPLIKSGQFRALAKLNSRPLTQLPDLAPLAVAAGLPRARRHVELDRACRPAPAHRSR